MAEARRDPFGLRRAVGRLKRSAYAALGRTGFGTITSVETRRPWVALTFDDGPDPDWTPRVLDLLDRYGGRATFFVVGERVARFPDVVRRIHEGGHAIGNHSHTHLSFPLIRNAERRRQLRACAAALAHYPQPRRLFRPPHLDQSLASRFLTWREGYEVVACTRHARDWEDVDGAQIALRLEELRAGDVVMLHDSIYGQPNRSRATMLDALETVLRREADRLEFVTVPALLAAGRPRRRLWLKWPPKDRRLIATAHLPLGVDGAD